MSSREDGPCQASSASLPEGFHAHSVGPVQLRGKEEELELYGVVRKA